MVFDKTVAGLIVPLLILTSFSKGYLEGKAKSKFLSGTSRFRKHFFLDIELYLRPENESSVAKILSSVSRFGVKAQGSLHIDGNYRVITVISSW